MKTTLRNNFHSMSITCRFNNAAKSSLSLKLSYGGVGGSGSGITQAAFDQAIEAFDWAWKQSHKKFANNGEFMKALNDMLTNSGAADPIAVANKINEFANSCEDTPV